MCSIDSITSTTRQVTISGEDGEDEVVDVPIWNGTVANIVLMSLGRSEESVTSQPAALYL